MINTGMPLERYLQKQRFSKVREYLKGDVLDFGGNDGELKQFVEGDYTLVNYDHSPMEGKTFDTIVLLAVIEHLHAKNIYDVFEIFKQCLRKDGTIFLTTPTPKSKLLLEALASVSLLDKENIEEHKHYWTESDLYALAHKSGFEVLEYDTFQLGFNQLMVLRHKK